MPAMCKLYEWQHFGVSVDGIYSNSEDENNTLYMGASTSRWLGSSSLRLAWIASLLLHPVCRAAHGVFVLWRSNK